MVPLIVVLCRSKTVSALRLPIELGIVPEILVLDRSRVVSAVRLPIELGIVPEILVLYRNRVVSAVRLPIELGIVPEILVLSRSRYVSAVKLPIELGIVPFKLLLLRRSFVTLNTDATFMHVTPYHLFPQGVPMFHLRLSLQVEPPVASNKSVSDAISLGVWHSPFWGRAHATRTISRCDVIHPKCCFPRFVYVGKIIHQFVYNTCVRKD